MTSGLDYDISNENMKLLPVKPYILTEIILQRILRYFFLIFFLSTNLSFAWNSLPWPDINVIEIFSDTMWVGTDAGLYLFLPTGEWISAPGFGVSGGLPVDKVLALTRSGDRIWAGFRTGLAYTENGENWTESSKDSGFPETSVYDFYYDGQRLWTATDKGIAVYDPAMQTWSYFTIQNGLPSNQVRCITGDETEIWIGTTEGLMIYDRMLDSWRCINDQSGLRNNDIRDLIIRDGYVWIASWGGGICRYSRDLGSWDYFTEEDVLPSDRVTCLADESGCIWAGCGEGGLVRYLRSTGTWRIMSGGNSPGSVSQLHAGKGLITVATATGEIFRFNISVGDWTRWPDSDVRLNFPLSDSVDEYSLRWGGGIYRSDSLILGMKEGLPSPWVTAIARKADSIAVGIDRGGVLIADTLGNIGRYLPSPSEFSITEARWTNSLEVNDSAGNIWSWDEGWRRISEEKPVLVSWPVPNVGRALISGKVMAAESWNNRLWLVEKGNHLWSISSEYDWIYHGRIAHEEFGETDRLIVRGGTLVCKGKQGWMACIHSDMSFEFLTDPSGRGATGDVFCQSAIFCSGNVLTDVSGDTVSICPEVIELIDVQLFDESMPVALDSNGKVWTGRGVMDMAGEAGYEVSGIWAPDDSLVISVSRTGIRLFNGKNWISPGDASAILENHYVREVVSAGNRLWFLCGWDVFSWDPDMDLWERYSVENGLSTGSCVDVAQCGSVICIAGSGTSIDIVHPSGIIEKSGFMSRCLPSADIMCLASLDDMLLVGCNRGVVLGEPLEDRWQQVFPLPVASGFVPHSVDCSDNMLAAGSDDRVMICNFDSGMWSERSPWFNGLAVSDVEYSPGFLWVSITNGYIYALNRIGDFWYSYTSGVSIPNGEVRSLESSIDRVWTATSFGAADAFLEEFRTPGWICYDGRSETGRRAVSSALAADISNTNLLRAVPFGRDALVLSTSTLEMLERSSETWEILLEFPRFSATDLVVNGKNWAVSFTDGSVICFSNGVQDTLETGYCATCLTFTNDRIAVGTDGNGVYLDGLPLSNCYLTGSPPLDIRDLSWDGKRIWIASGQGLFSYIPEEGSWQKWSDLP